MMGAGWLIRWSEFRCAALNRHAVHHAEMFDGDTFLGHCQHCGREVRQKAGGDWYAPVGIAGTRLAGDSMGECCCGHDKRDHTPDGECLGDEECECEGYERFDGPFD